MNRRAPFRQVDVTRALRAAKAAGIKVSRFEISPEGKIVVFGLTEGADDAVPPGRLAYEKWKAEQNAQAFDRWKAGQEERATRFPKRS